MSLFNDICDSELVKSPLNYMGGKYKLLPQILPVFPKEIDTFVDLFAGGCNVGINVKANHIISNDIICYLIDLYECLLHNSKEQSIEYINQRILQYQLSTENEEGFKCLRDEYNKSRNPLDLFVLVAYSFNYQIRFNSHHIYNTPFGRNRSTYNNAMRKNLNQFIDRLHSIDIKFSRKDVFTFDFSDLGPNDFVYCDPPYLITTGSYNDGKRGFNGWKEEDEYNLLALLDRLNVNGIKFALSNVLSHKGKNNHILAEWIFYSGYHVRHLKKNYATSSYHTINRDYNGSDEVLIFNYNIECDI